MSDPRRGALTATLAGLLAVVALAWVTFEVLERARRQRTASASAENLTPAGAPAHPGAGAVRTPTAADLAFRLAVLDGGELGPADFLGRTLIVDFWATWCLPCHLQTDVLVRAYPELRQRGVEVLAVDVGESEALVREHLAKSPVPYPVLLDPEDSILGGRLGVPVLPAILVIDRNGKVVFFDAGILDRPNLERVLRDAGVPPAPAAGAEAAQS